MNCAKECCSVLDYHTASRECKESSAGPAKLKMLPTYVRAVPNGEEHGDFLALDLGGTNFRILLIRLNGREAEMTGKVYSVPESIMHGTGESVSALKRVSSYLRRLDYISGSKNIRLREGKWPY